MPGYDKSGPIGEGPMTGWGQGPCGDGSGRTVAGAESVVGDRGGRGRRGGVGCRGSRGRFGQRGGMQPVGRQFAGDGDNLKSQVDDLQKSLAAIEQQLARINQKD